MDEMLIYLCGYDGSDTRKALKLELADKYFIKTNNFSKADFVEESVSVLTSSAFIFLLSKQSVADKTCLQLLGMAVAYDVPIIGVRGVGFKLDKPFPSIFKEKIVDRSRGSDVNTSNKVLTTVTTLENVLMTLYNKAVLYVSAKETVHKIESMVKSIKRNINRQRTNVQEQTRFQMKQMLFQQQKQTSPLSSTTVNNGLQKKKSSKKNDPKILQKPDLNKYSKLQPPSANEVQAKLTNGHGMPTFQVSAWKDSKNIPVLLTDHSYRSRRLRRTSSLPDISTNYLVSPENGKLEIFNYPTAINLMPKVSISGHSGFDEAEIHISRRCSSISMKDQEDIVFDEL